MVGVFLVGISNNPPLYTPLYKTDPIYRPRYKSGKRYGRFAGLNKKRWELQQQGETLTGEELCVSFGNNACRRENAFRFIRPQNEFEIGARMARQWEVPTARNVRSQQRQDNRCEKPCQFNRG